MADRTSVRTPVLIGVGNEYRSDDGIGPAVVAEVERHDLPGVRLVVSDGEPTGILDAWVDVPLAVVVDAVLCEPSAPGTIHRYETDTLPQQIGAASSHALGIPDALRLAIALDRAPRRLVVYAVEAADLGFGVEFSDPVAGALPAVVKAVVDELIG